MIHNGNHFSFWLNSFSIKISLLQGGVKHMNREVKDEVMSALKNHGIKAQIITWHNFTDTVKAPDALVIDIDSTKQAIRAMRCIHKINQGIETPLSIRAVAGWEDKSSSCFIKRFFDNLLHPTNRYHESYSDNASTAGDIIFRFTPRFQKNKLKIVAAGQQVEIPAGLQIYKLERYLSKHKRSLGTATMIDKVSAVGAVLNGCQGTGREQPTLSGYVSQLTLLQPDGSVHILEESDDDFATLMGANLGLTGVVLSMRLKTEAQFKLREKVAYYTNLEELHGSLPDWLEHEYFTTMITPLYGEKSIDDEVVPNIQVRVWDRTSDKISHGRSTNNYTIEDFASELSVEIGGEVQDLLLRPDMYEILKAYMDLAAVVIAAERGTEDKVDTANNTMHYQRQFPKSLKLVSFQLPVPSENASEILAQILAEAEHLQREISDSKAEIPVTYATYVRYIKGTSGGLSTCPEAEGHHVLVVEYVTHPHAHGFEPFIAGMRDFYAKNGWKPSFHLGKELPEPMDEFIEPDDFDAFKGALINWHGSEEAAFKNNPFFDPFLKKQFDLPLTEEEEHILASERSAPHIEDDEAVAMLRKLAVKLSTRMSHSDEVKSKVAHVCNLCNHKIDELEASLAEADVATI